MAFRLEDLTLEEWLKADAGTRGVVRDALLDRTQAGYVLATDTGMEPSAVPQFIHAESQVLFNVVFGGPFTFGMTAARQARAAAQRDRLTDEEGFSAPAPEPGPVDARAERVETFLLAEAPLLYAQLVKVGVPTADVRGNSVLVGEVPALNRLGWRLPTELEYEFALRAGSDHAEPLAMDPPGDLHPLGLEGLGDRELCAGGVVRGSGPLAWELRRLPEWWRELVWPGRRPFSVRDGALVRPAASLW